MLKIGLDIQVLEGKEQSGFGYYTRGLFDSLQAFNEPDLKIVPLKSRWKSELNTSKRFYHDRYELGKLAEKENVDILHQPCFSAPKYHKKVVWTLHDLRPLVLNEPMSLSASLYWKKWLPYSARYANKIVCTSEYTVGDAERYLGIKRDKISVIPIGVPTELLDWNMPQDNGDKTLAKFQISKPYFSSLGTIQPIKNYPFLIDVFVGLRHEFHIKHQLVIIGKKGWDYSSVVKKMKEHNLKEGKDIIITDYVTDNEKWTLISKSDTFLFPSLYEGFGIPPLEAQVLGAPILCANNSSLPSVVGKGAILCDAKQTVSWIEGYAKLQEIRLDVIHNGTENSKRFHWNKIAGEWIDLYKQM